MSYPAPVARTVANTPRIAKNTVIIGEGILFAMSAAVGVGAGVATSVGVGTGA